MSKLRVCLVGGVEKWEDRNGERMEKWEDKKDFNFPHLCLVGRMEKWKDEKLCYLFKKENGRIKNRICINLPLYPYLIKNNTL